MLIGLSGLVRALLDSFQVNEQARGMNLAVQAARTRVEELQGGDLSAVFASFNAFAGDDPIGAPGANFAVAGLDPDPEDADGMVGEIAFPVAAGAPGTLCETASFPGMPRDLNLDGDAADANVTATFGMLPVEVRLRWRGLSGATQVYEVRTILFGT